MQGGIGWAGDHIQDLALQTCIRNDDSGIKAVRAGKEITSRILHKIALCQITLTLVQVIDAVTHAGTTIGLGDPRINPKRHMGIVDPIRQDRWIAAHARYNCNIGPTGGKIALNPIGKARNLSDRQHWVTCSTTACKRWNRRERDDEK